MKRVLRKDGDKKCSNESSDYWAEDKWDDQTLLLGQPSTILPPKEKEDRSQHDESEPFDYISSIYEIGVDHLLLCPKYPSEDLESSFDITDHPDIKHGDLLEESFRKCMRDIGHDETFQIFFRSEIQSGDNLIQDSEEGEEVKHIPPSDLPVSTTSGGCVRLILSPSVEIEEGRMAFMKVGEGLYTRIDLFCGDQASFLIEENNKIFYEVGQNRKCSNFLTNFVSRESFERFFKVENL